MTNQEKFIQIFGIVAWQAIIVFSGLAEQYKEYWTSPYKEMDCRDCKNYKDCPCGKDGHESGTSQGYSIGECKDFELFQRIYDVENSENKNEVKGLSKRIEVLEKQMKEDKEAQLYKLKEEIRLQKFSLRIAENMNQNLSMIRKGQKV